MRGDEAPCSRPAAVPVEVLRAIVRGDAAAARAGGRELAIQVLASPTVRLALQVLAGGEFIDQRIAELCDAMLASGENAATRRRGAA